MRILLCSHWFAPSVGGVETVSKIMAEGFSSAGASVTVATNTAGPATSTPYSIIRRPSQFEMYALARHADIVLQNMISLRTLPGLLASQRPVVITHHSWLRRKDGTRGFENYIKLLALRACHNISISNAIAASLPVESTVIGNPFESQEFGAWRDRSRDKDFVFLGRLVSDKGCAILLRALSILKKRGSVRSLTVIGDGPERGSLMRLASELGIDSQVEFVGMLEEGRGKLVSRHRVMVVPSLWAEPFGVVALEGIASGCAIVASAQGGLPDAVGPCGLYFPNGDVVALASVLEELITNTQLRNELTAPGSSHLKSFETPSVIQRYLDYFENVLSASRG